jgi:hypothetical protein
VEREPPGGVQQPVAKRLGFADREIAFVCELLGPGDQVLRDQRNLQPDGVEVELRELEVSRPVCLAALMRSSAFARPRCIRSISTVLAVRSV